MRAFPPPRRLFHPRTHEELLKGWMLHAHKGRDRHDEAARRLDRYHRTLGGLSALFSAIVGTSLFVQLGKQATTGLAAVLVGCIGLIAAVLTSILTASNAAARAESHRVAGVRYKAAIRELEYLMTERAQHGASYDERLERALGALEAELDALEKESPVVPLSIYRRIEKRYVEVDFVERAIALGRPVPA